MFVKELSAIIPGLFFSNKTTMNLKKLVLISLNQEVTDNIILNHLSTFKNFSKIKPWEKLLEMITFLTVTCYINSIMVRNTEWRIMSDLSQNTLNIGGKLKMSKNIERCMRKNIWGEGYIVWTYPRGRKISSETLFWKEKKADVRHKIYQ